MKQRLHRPLRLAGLALLVLTLTCAFLPGPDADGRVTALALRQLGHDYLLATGDATSTVPPVRERTDGSYLLPLNRTVSYDTLAVLSRGVMEKYGIEQPYTLALEDCATGELFLGSLWKVNAVAGDDGAACVGRDQDVRCASISLAIHGEQPATSPPVLVILGGLGVLLLLAAPVGKSRPEPVAASIGSALPVSHLITVGPDCLLNETALLLQVGQREIPVTYREAKLLTYLSCHANAVLERATIHEAVWGEEGIITGRSLDVFVSRLRKKLAEAGGLEIQTVHGVGYRFVISRG